MNIKSLLEEIFVKVLVSLFGASWKTTLTGYIQLFVVTVWTGYQSFHSGTVTSEQIQSLAVSGAVAVLGRFAKDHDVSNSPVPLKSAVEVHK